MMIRYNIFDRHPRFGRDFSHPFFSKSLSIKNGNAGLKFGFQIQAIKCQGRCTVYHTVNIAVVYCVCMGGRGLLIQSYKNLPGHVIFFRSSAETSTLADWFASFITFIITIVPKDITVLLFCSVGSLDDRRRPATGNSWLYLPMTGRLLRVLNISAGSGHIFLINSVIPWRIVPSALKRTEAQILPSHARCQRLVRREFQWNSVRFYSFTEQS